MGVIADFIAIRVLGSQGSKSEAQDWRILDSFGRD